MNSCGIHKYCMCAACMTIITHNMYTYTFVYFFSKQTWIFVKDTHSQITLSEGNSNLNDFLLRQHRLRNMYYNMYKWFTVWEFKKRNLFFWTINVMLYSTRTSLIINFVNLHFIWTKYSFPNSLFLESTWIKMNLIYFEKPWNVGW